MKNSPNLKFKITVNGKEIENTFTSFKREYLKARKTVQNNPIGSDAWEEAAKNMAAYKKLMEEAEDAQADFMNSMKADEEVLKEFFGSLSQLFTGLKKGNYADIKAGFNGVAGSIRGVGKAALSLMATPLGATIALLTGISFAVREWVKYNESIKKSAMLTERITGIVGEQSHKVRLHGETIAKVFNQDFSQVLGTANTLVQKFKISWDDALNVIEEGLIEGQVVNEEYLESLNEYAPFLADAGYSVKEFKNIISKGYDMGVFQDKLPDALKEFHLSMTEQGASTQAALDNAFGIKFTDKLFKGIKKGTITTKKALQTISKESKKYGLSVQQQQQLTADLFRGAGEDAGGALKIFEAINSALDSQTRIMTPLQQLMKDTSEAHRELAESKDEALRSDEYVAFAGELNIIWVKIQTIFYDALAGLRNGFSGWTQFLIKRFSLSMAIVKAFPMVVQDNFRLVMGSIKELIGATFSFGEVFNKLLRLDFDGAKEAAKKYSENVSASFTVAKNAVGGIGDEISRIRKEAGKQIDLKFAARKQGFVDMAKLEEEKKAAAEAQKLREHMTRKQLEELRKRLKKEKEYRDQIILASEDAFTQEKAAHQERLKEAGLFGKKKEKLTSDEKKALELLELKYNTNIARIESSAIKKYLRKLKSKYENEKRLRQIAHNNEIAGIDSLEQAKAMLSAFMSKEELKKIRDISEAKDALNREFEKKELDHQAEFLNEQIQLMTSALNGEDTGINLADKLLTDEQKEILKARIEDIKLKLSEIGVERAAKEEEGKTEEVVESDVDIFGFSITDWHKTFNNLDTANEKIAAGEVVVGGLMNAWGMYHEFLAAGEKRSLSNFEKSTNKKKAALKKQLDAGIIDKEEFNKLTEKLDKDLAKKKAEIEYKQAKREKSMALVGAVVNTAMAIVKAFSDLGPIGGAIAAAAIGIMGGVQIATIAKQPLPDKNVYADGGFTTGVGYVDETGHEVAGVVHADEYVIPKFVMNSTDPAIPAIVDYLETSRKMKLGKFADGGFTTAPAPTFNPQSSTQTIADDFDTEEIDPQTALTQVVRRLLDEGIQAYSLIGDEQILELEERLQKLKQSRENAKRR